jgi:hypothetical protein
VRPINRNQNCDLFFCINFIKLVIFHSHKHLFTPVSLFFQQNTSQHAIYYYTSVCCVPMESTVPTVLADHTLYMSFECSNARLYYCSGLKMVAVCSSKTLTYSQNTTQCNNSEQHHLYTYILEFYHHHYFQMFVNIKLHVSTIINHQVHWIALEKLHTVNANNG